MSKPRPGEKAQCWAKQAYNTVNQANKGIEHVRHKFGNEMRFYRCRFCDKLHLTTKRG